MSGKVLALSGGVGGAKLAFGLSQCVAADQLCIVANTGDDFSHLGVAICPDLDTVMYTLAGLANAVQGWGLEGESWQLMSALDRLGGETWFRLGDRDMATHLRRTALLAEGLSLERVTASLCRALSVEQTLLPMSDDPVRTQVHTAQGWLAFQDYFVRQQCAPQIDAIRFQGIDSATAAQGFRQALVDPALSAIVICPSNPFVSVDPILALPDVREALISHAAPVIAVSPIIAGAALKGPAAKMMAALAMPVCAGAVAAYYGDLLDGFVIDNADSSERSAIEALGLPVLQVNTIMRSTEAKIALAADCLEFAASLS